MRDESYCAVNGQSSLERCTDKFMKLTRTQIDTFLLRSAPDKQQGVVSKQNVAWGDESYCVVNGQASLVQGSVETNMLH